MKHKNRFQKSDNEDIKKGTKQMEENEKTEVDEQQNIEEKQNTDNSAENKEDECQQDDKQAESEDEKSTESQEEKPAEDFESKFNELNDKYLRLAAEYDNYRKRTLKEKMDLTKYAEEDVLCGILPVIDNMERAIKSLETATDINAVKEGIDLIYSKFKSFIESRGVKEIQALHQDLDTDLHEAVTKFAAPSEDLKGKIIDIIEKGYKLNDKVIRFAKVVVGE